MQRALGIDLGESNSVMGFMSRDYPKIILNRDNRNRTPSIVSRGRRGELLVGVSAKARALIEPQNTISSIKRFMGRKFADPTVQKAIERVSYKVTEGVDGDVRVWLADREYTPIEISAIILHRLKEDAENRQSEKFTRAAITVPAYFGERQVAATREAGRMAGFHVLRIINEPTAAALAFGLNREQDEESKTILVYDLGGKSFDISILMMMQGAITVMGIEGDNLLGGDDFDHDLVEYLLAEVKRQHGVDLSKDRIALQKIRQESENAKIVLSSQISYEIILPFLVREAIDLEVEITRADFEWMIRPRIERTIELTHKVIREASLTPDNIDHILLVGGSTSIPLVEELLKQVFGADKIRKNVYPMESVALGATIQTALIAEIECSNCQTRNSMMNDYCSRCHAPLFGKDKVSCPTCYVPCDLGEPNCWKCGAALTLPEISKSVGYTPVFVEQKCPNCGKPFKTGAMTCSICDFVLVKQASLQCPNCGHLNAQGATVCSKCSKEIMVSSPSDMTMKPIGIALESGRMSIIIDKGTYFPTHDSIRKEFKTTKAGQRRFEIKVLEGFSDIANQNEICGIISIPLPPGLRNGSPISIGFGLDESRTITVEVELREAAGDKHVKAQIKRGALDPERARKVREKYGHLTEFMDYWSDELTEAERADLQVMLRELEQAMSGDTNALRQPLELLIARSDLVLARIIRILAVDGHATKFLQAQGKYLNAPQKQIVGQWIADLEQARERADWAASEAIADQIDAELDKYALIAERQKKRIATSRRRLPLYILVDCSRSMQENVNALHQYVQFLIWDLVRHSEKMDSIWCSLIVFGCSAHQASRLTELMNFVVPTFATDLEQGTALGPALRRLDQAIDTEVIAASDETLGDYSPIAIIFLGDEPSDKWQAAAKQLLERRDRRLAKIAAVTFGNDASKTDLSMLTKNQIALPSVQAETYSNLLEWLDQTSDGSNFEINSRACMI